MLLLFIKSSIILTKNFFTKNNRKWWKNWKKRREYAYEAWKLLCSHWMKAVLKSLTSYQGCIREKLLNFKIDLTIKDQGHDDFLIDLHFVPDNEKNEKTYFRLWLWPKGQWFRSFQSQMTLKQKPSFFTVVVSWKSICSSHNMCSNILHYLPGHIRFCWVIAK